MNHAYVLVQFAIEELGKILLITEAFNSDPNDPFSVNGEFFSHKVKDKKAWKILDRNCRMIFDEGVFEAGVFEMGIFKQNTEASHWTRCECAFVDFTGSQWILGRDIKEELL